MEFMDNMKISEMTEGKAYPITQGHDASSGVIAIKKGDEIHFRHYWDKEDDEEEDGFHFFEGEFGFPVEEEYDQTEVLHKDVLNFLPMDLLQEVFEIPKEKMNLSFEDMTIGDFYQHISMGIYHLKEERYEFPAKLKELHKTYARNGKFLF